MLFKVCAKYFPFSPFTRIFNLLACASPKLEQLPTSKYFFCLGDHASTSIDLTLRSAKSPEQHSNVLTGISNERNKSTVFFHNLSILYFLLAYKQLSFLVFRIDEFYKLLFLQFHEHPFLF